ncbi:hypothetical protein SRABI83_02307 [Arthrobacter sp. Bi83]|nr:hypothetical protein SRABI83_02307 [Arthrobacter sp. Bi83]
MSASAEGRTGKTEESNTRAPKATIHGSRGSPPRHASPQAQPQHHRRTGVHRGRHLHDLPEPSSAARTRGKQTAYFPPPRRDRDAGPLAPPSSGPAVQEFPCGAPSSLISSGNFPPLALRIDRASVAHSSASFASSQNNGGEGTPAGHLSRPATGKTTWSAPAPVSTRLTDIEASGERGRWPVTDRSPPTPLLGQEGTTP